MALRLQTLDYPYDVACCALVIISWGTAFYFIYLFSPGREEKGKGKEELTEAISTATPSTFARGSSGSVAPPPTAAGWIMYASVGPTSALSVSTHFQSDLSRIRPWKLLHTNMIAFRRGRNGTSLNTSMSTVIWGGGFFSPTLPHSLALRNKK